MSDDHQPPANALSEVIKHWTKSCLEESEQTQEDLQNDSRTFFKYLTHSTEIVTEGNIKLATKSSHEAALAKLINDLGPAFSAEHHESRLRALHVLVGAIEGCHHTQFSNTITKLLGSFLLSHCGPIDDDAYGEDYDSMIRNAAIMGLTALSRVPASTNADPDVLESFRMRLQFVRQGIETRCAMPDTMQDSNDHYSYGFNNHSTDMREQLSNLPRSKRSLCFGLVGSGVAGIAAITDQMKEPLEESSLLSLQTDLIEYARFSSSCLHGESDPRCLQQLLRILHEMQTAFTPYFLSTGTQTVVFPSEDLFDAVAPYFPVQFTPPPNNIHQITREGLHEALVSVLCFTKMDANAQSHSRHTMLSLSAGLFIEQLMPMEGEEPSSTLDKLDAVKCLSRLLFPSDRKSLCDMLDVSTLRNLWAAIKLNHDESSTAISLEGHHGANNKLLADKCRTLVSKLAYQLEMSANKSLWEVFISEPILKQKKTLKMSPSNSKLTIAYMACLTASGGPRTLRFCLGVGLELLLDYLEENLDDTEDVSAAAHGVAAFFSSCQVAIDRGRKEGVELSPHPLEPYAAKACQILLDAFERESLSSSIKTGAIRSLEFLVLAISVEQLEENHLERLCLFIRKLMEMIQGASTNLEWRATCCSTLGLIVGNTLLTETTSAPGALLSSAQIRDLVKEEIYPKLLRLASSSAESSPSDRSARDALSVACVASEDIASEIICSLLENLSEKLGNNPTDVSCMVYCEFLSHILRHGGAFAVKSYHANPLSSGLLKALSRGVSGTGDIRASISNLTLPNTAEQQAFIYSEVSVRLITNTCSTSCPCFLTILGHSEQKDPGSHCPFTSGLQQKRSNQYARST